MKKTIFVFVYLIITSLADAETYYLKSGDKLVFENNTITVQTEGEVIPFGKAPKNKDCQWRNETFECSNDLCVVSWEHCYKNKGEKPLETTQSKIVVCLKHSRRFLENRNYGHGWDGIGGREYFWINNEIQVCEVDKIYWVSLEEYLKMFE